MRDAEQYKQEDEKQRERVSAKNGLESYVFAMKSTMDDDKLKDKISEDDKKAISTKCDETLKWLDANQVCSTSSTIHSVKTKKFRFLLSPDLKFVFEIRSYRPINMFE